MYLNELNIPLIIPCYNRPDSLDRLLKSINSAKFNSEVDLIISIDGGGCPIVCEVAERYDWKFGKKKLIKKELNLGLKEHIIACGNLILENNYDGAIILEDDLFISPYFYDYVIKASEFYRDEKNVAGISLYTPMLNETTFLPFVPLKNDFDIYFMQLASSWGQVWLKEHWLKFKKFLNSNHVQNWESELPNNIYSWPSSSWKKEYNKFLIYNNLYFVYPYYSLSTNFAEAGTHYKDKTTILQVPILSLKKEWKFPNFNTEIIKYDIFGELMPKSFSMLNPILKKYSYEVNLNFSKKIKNISSEFVLTQLNDENDELALISFDDELAPIENNIVLNLNGKKIGIIPATMMEEKTKNTEEIIKRRFNISRQWLNIYYVKGRESIISKFPRQLIKTIRFVKNILISNNG